MSKPFIRLQTSYLIFAVDRALVNILISNIFLCGNFDHLYNTFIYNISNKMISHINVFRPLMERLTRFTLYDNIFQWRPNPFTIPFNQMSSCTASIIAMYSASLAERATTDCNAKCQLIAAPIKVNTYPN